MQPGARISAIIEIFDEIAKSTKPADRVVEKYVRDRRYIGSKDRLAIISGLYGLLRAIRRIDWWIAQFNQQPETRIRAIAWMVLGENWDLAQFDEHCDGYKYKMEGLSDAEKQFVGKLQIRTLDDPEQPIAVQAECPDWAAPSLQTLFGDDFLNQMRALQNEAPFDLRVNLLKTSRTKAMADLAVEGATALPTKLSPWGLRLEKRAPVGNFKMFKNGDIEVQDEASQLVSLITDAQPGMQVTDFCAGAGGKALGLSMMMQNKGTLYVCDIEEYKLQRAKERLRRAGVHNHHVQLLTTDNNKFIKRRGKKMDRVLVDAPCSNIGTWRRNPDAKWRVDAQVLEKLTALQRQILTSAGRLVKPGGLLVYATCSLLPEENEHQANWFLQHHPDFQPVPIDQVYNLPSPAAPFLRLTPASNNTDGFFVACFQRAMDVKQPPEQEQETQEENDG